MRLKIEFETDSSKNLITPERIALATRWRRFLQGNAMRRFSLLLGLAAYLWIAWLAMINFGDYLSKSGFGHSLGLAFTVSLFGIVKAISAKW